MSNDDRSDGDSDQDRDDAKTVEDSASTETGFDEDPIRSDQERTDPFGLETNSSATPDDHEAQSTGDSPTDASEESGASADAPLGSLAATVDERRSREADRPDDGLFDEESVPEIDTDVVWEQLDDADEPTDLPDEDEQDVRVIEKRSYCEQCPFFSDPPEVNCSHEGTEILELVNMEQFRVVDCPKVREDERLERL
ncbi:hypothetical protein [Salinarchaeum laminariae]|uniref:hypothetical protein n=1 Tax=Salinarchaeum laminariae TaxID=869888 RepID=UPI0020BD5DBC|nr:hypothetical protein [Salinarchaeum laminariae]